MKGRPSRYSEAMIRDAIEQTLGNVTHAASILGVSKVHAMRLTAKHQLRQFALDIRLQFGCSPTGKQSPRV